MDRIDVGPLRERADSFEKFYNKDLDLEEGKRSPQTNTFSNRLSTRCDS